MKEIVFASHNDHKLREVREIFSAMGIAARVLGMADIDCTEDIPETGDSIEVNARQKAEYVARRYGVTCFADDTGLFVDVLNGEPGVRTARFASDECDAQANMKLLLELLQGVDGPARTARFRTVIALAFPDGRPVQTFSGSVEGHIAEEIDTGGRGFGYDPVFIAAESGLPFSRMSAEDKNRISHRGRALANFAAYMGSSDFSEI